MKKPICIYTMTFIILLLSSCSIVGNEESLAEVNNEDNIQSLNNVDSGNVVTEYSNDTENNTYEIILIQTEELLPLIPEDDDFDIYKSAYYGEFELRLIKDERIIDSLNLNDCFGLEKIGFIGKFTLADDDINNDGNADFNIGIMNDGIFEFIVFTVRDNKFDAFQFDDSKILMRVSPHHSKNFKKGLDGEIIITLPKEIGGFYEKIYYWDGAQFLSK